MKTLELNLKKKILIVELPNNECEFGGLLNKRNLYFFTEKMNSTDYPASFLLSYDCEFICKGSELTELIAYKFVKENSRHGTNTSFVNYKGEKSFFFALESFISAIEAQDYYWGENPIEKPLKDSNFYFADMTRHFEAESKTFNPEKTLIFEILL